MIHCKQKSDTGFPLRVHDLNELLDILVLSNYWQSERLLTFSYSNIDFTKACDRINHELSFKRNWCNMVFRPGIWCNKSYLHLRTQHLKMRSTTYHFVHACPDHLISVPSYALEQCEWGLTLAVSSTLVNTWSPALEQQLSLPIFRNKTLPSSLLRFYFLYRLRQMFREHNNDDKIYSEMRRVRTGVPKGNVLHPYFSALTVPMYVIQTTEQAIQ